MLVKTIKNGFVRRNFLWSKLTMCTMHLLFANMITGNILYTQKLRTNKSVEDEVDQTLQIFEKSSLLDIARKIFASFLLNRLMII